VSRARSEYEPGGHRRFIHVLTLFASFVMVVSVLPQLPVAPVLERSETAAEFIVAAGAPPSTTSDVAVTDTDISSALSRARSDWAAVVPAADLTAVTAASSDLGGLELASTSGTAITVDVDAAGWGWSVSFPGEPGHMDLLTVLRHELGHVLGLAHTGTGLMRSTLGADEVRGVTLADAEPLLPSDTAEPIDAATTDAESDLPTDTVDGDPSVEPSTDAEPLDTAGTDGAGLSVAPVAVDYGDVEIGSSSTMSVTLTNDDVIDIDVTGAATDAAEFSIDITLLPATLPPGGSITLEATFAPVTSGPASGELAFATSDPSVAAAMLIGTGFEAIPNITLTTTSIDFGVVEVGHSDTRTLIIGNDGSADLTISSVSSSSPSFDPSGIGWPASIPPGGSATITVTFDPSVVGAFTADLTVASDDPDGPSIVALIGSGAEPEATVSTTSIDFGTVAVGYSDTGSVEMVNSGAVVLSITGLSVIGDPDSVFSVSTGFPISIPTGGSATLDVGFAPTGLAARDAQLVIQTTDPSGPIMVDLVGSGTLWHVDESTGTATVAPLGGDAWRHAIEYDATTKTVKLINESSGTNTEFSLDASITAVRVRGGAGEDSITIAFDAAAAPFALTFDGGDGTDTLTGPVADTVWTVAGVGSGTAAGIGFGSVENLSGAANNEDTFVFEPGGGLQGLVDGGAAGFDSLVIDGGSYDSVVFSPTGPDSGTVTLDGTVITYVGLEPVVINSGTASDVVFNLTSSDDTATLQPDGGNLKLTGGTFEDTLFAAPTNSLTINGGDGYDSVTLVGVLNLGAAAFTVTAEVISVTGTLTAGDVTLTAAHTVTGGVIAGAADCLLNFSAVGTHCGEASVTVDGGSISGAAIDLSATSTVTPDSFNVLLPGSSADISLKNGASVVATGNVTLASSSTVTINAAEALPVAVTGDSTSSLLIENSTISSGAAVVLSSSSTFNSQVSSGADPLHIDDGTSDAAVAVAIIGSTARTLVTGSSGISAIGDLTVKAINKTDVTTTGDADIGGVVGAGIAVTHLTETTEAFIESTGLITAANFTLSADSDNSVKTVAKASPGGATMNAMTPNQRTTNPATGQGNAKTSDGSVDLAGALAFTYLSAPTEAHISATGLTITTTGEQKIHAESKNTSSAEANGTAVTSGSTGVGVAVAVNIADVTVVAFAAGTATLDATKLTIEALIPATATFSAKSTSGAKGGETDVAGSLAVNVATVLVEASIASAASLTLNAGGTDIGIKAESTTENKVTAKAKVSGGGDTTGFGASVGINIDDC